MALWAALALLWAAVAAVMFLRGPLSDPGTGGPAAEADAGASESNARAGSGRLELRVRDGEGQPVSRARVSVTVHREGQSPVGGTVHTDDQGRARIVGLPDGLASVTIEHPGHARITRPATIAGGTGLLEVVLRLGARLSGVVVDTEGAPVPDAWVRVRPALDDATPPWETRSDDEGAFSFDTLRDERLRLEAGAEGFETVGRRARPGDDTLRIALRRTGTLTGEVHGPAGGPGAGAIVVLAGSGVWPPRRVTAGDDGTFRFTGVPGGVYELRAQRGTEVAEPREGILLGPGASAHLELTLAPGQTLRGRVISADDDAPIGGAEVVVSEEALAFSPAAVETDENGGFEVPGLRALPHRVSVHAEGFVAVVGELHAPGAEMATFALRRAAVLEGTVVDEDGYPVAGARVEIVGTGEGGDPMTLTGGEIAFRSDLFHAQQTGPLPASPTGELGVTFGEVPPIPLGGGSGSEGPAAPAGSLFVTDAHGDFRLTGVPPGRLTLVARHPEHAPGSGPTLFVAAGSSHDGLRIVLPRGGRIEGRVVDGRGFHVPFVRIEMHCEREPFPRFAVANDNGEFSFEGALDTTTLTAYPSGQPAARKTLTVLSGETLEVTLELEGELVTLSARTVDGRGFPIAGVLVTVRSLRARSPVRRTARSGDDGTVEIGALPPPPYRLEADDPGYALLTLPRVQEVERELTLTLHPGAAVLGRVLDDFDGVPLAGAQVSLEGRRTSVGQAASDAEGYFEIPRIPAGNYTVIVSASDFVTLRQEAALRARPRGLSDLDLSDLRLAAGGSITGEVVDAIGSPVAGAEVTSGEPPDWRGAQRTDARGHFRIPGIAPGEVRVTARHPAAGEAAEGPLRVFPKQDTPGVRLHLPERYDPEAVDPGPAQQSGVAASLSDRGEAVVVTHVAAGSSARRAGLRRGDVLRAVDDERVINAAHGRGMLRGPAGVEVILELRRGRRTLRLPVPRERWTPPG